MDRATRERLLDEFPATGLGGTACRIYLIVLDAHPAAAILNGHELARRFKAQPTNVNRAIRSLVRRGLLVESGRSYTVPADRGEIKSASNGADLISHEIKSAPNGADLISFDGRELIPFPGIEPPGLANGPDDVPRPPSEPADPAEAARYLWVCDWIDRMWPDRYFGYNLVKFQSLGYDAVQLYQAATIVATYSRPPRSLRAFLSLLREWATEGPPAITPAELPPELGGTLGSRRANIVPNRVGAGPEAPASHPARHPPTVEERREQARKGLAIIQERERERAQG